MKAVYFGTANGIYNKGEEDEFYAYTSEDGATVMCMQLDTQEIKQINETGKIWITAQTLGKAMIPLYDSLLNPFDNEFVECECGCLEVQENATVDEENNHTCLLCMEKV